jgi:large subunit ribosomal protein L24
MQKIKKGDEIVVIAGKDKGKRGTVEQVLSNGKLIVGGVNLVKKHTKPNPALGVAGGIVTKEMAIEASNVMLFNAKSGKGERVGIKQEADGTKVRFFKASGDLVG